MSDTSQLCSVCACVYVRLKWAESHSHTTITFEKIKKEMDEFARILPQRIRLINFILFLYKKKIESASKFKRAQNASDITI